ncbi:NAD(P)-binding protein [Massarina eburnea CBS 473.64]|uniref:NAD(P)-binding protein n=1 Tax=Massarina eburnea CBS 473.64 TaxID=1395130 RepID=A0A6A6RPH3_9PLEO|nr:NAD(P)-binding protein [Massarina eburnea CBS 473.64]
MAARINTILIIGGTSGIGEQVARRFHSLGKKVIVTGRNEAKLNSLAKELNGLETRKFDITDFATLPREISEILKAYPTLDSAILNAGIQNSWNLLDATSIEPSDIEREITTNLTAPAMLVQLLAPHFLRLALKGTKTTFFLTSSSLAYVPWEFYPTYSASKAGVHALALTLRHQILYYAPVEAKVNFNVVEIVPPYTDTGSDKDHREYVIAMQGGPDRAWPIMPVGEFVEGFFKELEDTEEDGSVKKEIGVGIGKTCVETWRGSLQTIYDGWMDT